MTREVFATALAVLTETFRVTLGDGGVAGYWQVLGNLTPDELQHACLRAISTCEFMPAPAKLLAFVRERRQATSLVEATNRRALEVEAWTKRPAGRALEAVRDTIRELAEMKALDEKGS